MCWIVADERERAIIPLLQAVVGAARARVATIATADYAICAPGDSPDSPPRVFAAVERKTHADFAASLADGRHRNVEKLRRLRAATGCALYYFVEGPAFPRKDSRVGRTPFGCILGAMTSLMVRDGIMVVLTRDRAHTAERLGDFLAAYDRRESDPRPAATNPRPAVADPLADSYDDADGSTDTHLAGDIVAGGERADAAAEYVAVDAAAAAAGEALAVPAELTARPPPDPEGELAAVWRTLNGVADVAAAAVAARWSVADLAAGRVPPEAVTEFALPSGRLLCKTGRASLARVAAGDADVAARLLGGIAGVTPRTAADLLSQAGGLARLLALDAGALGELQVAHGGGGRGYARFGVIRAERMLEICHRRGSAPGPDPDAQLQAAPTRRVTRAKKSSAAADAAP